MSKAIIISIRPKWVAAIIRGDKILEIRKSMPKCDLPIEVYIYCCKHKYGEIGCHINFKRIEGKVVGKFTMYGCLPMKPKNIKNWKTQLDNACLTEEEYLGYSKGKGTYQWVIDDLEIFDKPREISEFKVRSHTVNGIGLNGKTQKFEILKPLSKAPESYCFVEKEN